MPSVIVRDMPVEVHRRLKSAAMQHHRSMNREVLMILEQTLGADDAAELPLPLKPLRPISGDAIVSIIRNMMDRAR